MPETNLKEAIIEDLTELQKYIILLLRVNDFEAVRGALWLQKELFLLSKNLENLKEDADFEADLMGPYSEIADEEIKQLQLANIIKLEGNRILLTDLGRKISAIIDEVITKEEKLMASDFKSLLNDLTEDELLGLIYFNFPESAQESIKICKVVENRKKIAFNLYKKGKISLGKASEIAGENMEDMMRILKEKGFTIYS